jgi:sugar phosphate isomerase/epimerase
MSGLGIEFISAFGMPPVQFIELAAELDCQYVTTTPQPIDYNPENFKKFDLVEDAALRREVKAALKANGITISLGEGLVVLPNVDTRTAYSAALDAFAEIGIPRLNVCAMDPDRTRSFDEMAVLAEMAGSRGMVSVVEYAPVFAANDLAAGIAALRHIGRNDCKLLVDTMHAGRTHTNLAELAALGEAKIGYIQLCDAPRIPVIADYIEEAMFQRRVPGEGEMPLLDLLTVLPRNVVVGLEVPLRDEAEAGIPAKARMRRCVAAARALLAQLPM